MILFLHNRYRTTGGEERVVDELVALVRERLGMEAQLLARDSAVTGRGRAALGLLRGGLWPGDVERSVRLTGARVLHAHNLHPSFGWRALAAAREAGAAVVLHLHQYRLVCANGVCFTQGQDCVRCHARNTLPGVAFGCRGSRAEGLVYGAALSLWQRRMAQMADAVIVPSVFAGERLRELGAPLDFERVHVLPPPVAPPPARTPSASGGYALVVSRLSVEKGVDVAIEACRRAAVPLVVAGDGPQLAELRRQAGAGAAGSAGVRFEGRVPEERLGELRAGAAVALVPSRSAETFGMAAAEAMVAGVPVLASRIGALPELVGEDGLVPPADAQALAAAIERCWDDRMAGERGRERVASLCAPDTVAGRLARIYDDACAQAAGRAASQVSGRTAA